VPVHRTKEEAFTPRPFLRWIALAGAVLVASVLGVPSASAIPGVPSAPAIPPGKAPSAVEAVAPPVTRPSAPSLPSAAPPQAPVPAVPKGPPGTSPALPTPPAGVPSIAKAPGAPPNSSHSVRAAPSDRSSGASGRSVDLPSASQVTSGTKELAGRAASTSTEQPQRLVPSTRGGVGEGPGSHGAGRSGIGADAVEPAKPASPARFLARVWPAIALGPVERLLAMLQMPREAAASLPISDIPRLLLGVTELTGTSSDAGGPEHSASSNPPPRDSTGTWVPDGSEISLFVLIAFFAALTALLVLTVRRELGSTHRWPL
jgi:hypothetical protein